MATGLTWQQIDERVYRMMPQDQIAIRSVLLLGTTRLVSHQTMSQTEVHFHIGIKKAYDWLHHTGP
jgi:hypothetical protein